MHTEHDEWEQEPEEQAQALTVSRPKNWVTSVKLFLQKHWNPKPMISPEVDPALPQLSGIERCAEVVRYCLISFEHWLSKSGHLREWIRLNLRIALFIAAPSLLVVPWSPWLFSNSVRGLCLSHRLRQTSCISH